MRWDIPLNAKLDAITSAISQSWQNSIDAAVAIAQRGITPVVNSGTEIVAPVDGQVVYITSSRVYERYNGPTSAWVPFLTAGANGSFINSYAGAWTAQSYATGAIVTYLGASWISTGAVSSSQIPGTDAAWTAITATGAAGANGNTILNGASNPTSGQGVNGDFFINNTAETIFGPKSAGAWPSSGTSLVGPTGAAGQGVVTGGTTGQYLKKNSNTNYDTVWGAILDADINTLASITNKALDSAVVHLANTETITGVKTFTASPVVPSNAFPEAAITNLTSDLAARLLLAGGTMTGTIAYTGTAVTNLAGESQITGDTQQRYTQRLDGQMAWGTGAATSDTNLRRSGVGVLATDNNLAAVLGVQVGAATTAFGGGVGVIGIANAATAPTSNPSGGGVLYSSSGAPTWRDPNGNVWSLQPPNRNYPSDQNLIGWTYEPQLANGSASALTAGVMLLSRVLLKTAATITNIIVNITTAAVGNTNTYVALFDFTGTQRGVSADQSTSFQSTGTKTVALTTPYAAAQGSYWVALLVGAASTLPQFSASTSSTVPASLANLGLTASTARWATNGSGLTAIPSTLTPASNTLSNGSIFAALS
jgi:hypothetical protein